MALCEGQKPKAQKPANYFARSRADMPLPFVRRCAEQALAERREEFQHGHSVCPTRGEHAPAHIHPPSVLAWFHIGRIIGRRRGRRHTGWDVAPSREFGA